MIHGTAEVSETGEVVPEYEAVMRRTMPAEQADAYFGELRRRGTRMERIAVRPAWVGVVDFETRFPGPMPEWLRS
ncbi:hypothetical protein [Actinophytocola sp.]|uniref:hypothetical protein n=1 Tax=Actinophytocola sp. TaxID=1872138 RepID=UPI0025C0AA01|nr:hypothetical protein [Actinophytocola sp.]